MTKEQIVEKIKKLRREKGYSVHKLSNLSHVAYTTCSRIEKTNADMNVQTLQKICNALEISMKDFFDESEEHISDKPTWYLVGWVSQSNTIFSGIALRTELNDFLHEIKDGKGYIFAISKIDEDIKDILEKNESDKGSCR